jgi:hypothetical protein
MSGYQPLTTVLGPWFDRPLARLPSKLRRRVQKEFLIPWAELSPRRREMVALKVDWEHHPGLQQGHRAWWDKHSEIEKCERTASKIPIEVRTAADVDFQERKLSELRKELAAIEAALHQTAGTLGLVIPGDANGIWTKLNGESASTETPVIHVTDAEWSDATVGDQGTPGSASSRIAAARDAEEKEAGTPDSLDDLPAWWSLHQSIAWIMFRSGTLVSDVMGTGVRGFSARIAYAEHEDGLPLSVPNLHMAERELLRRARAVDIHARGKIAGREGRQPIEPLDWVDGKLSEERDHPVLSPIRQNGKFWYDIMLPKDVVVSLWPPVNAQFPSIPEGISTPPIVAGHGNADPPHKQANGGTASTLEPLLETSTNSNPTARRQVGRPNARNTSVSVYNQRRADRCPPLPSQLAEAEAIVAMWPTDGPPRPKAKTVSGHISALWSQSDKL